MTPLSSAAPRAAAPLSFTAPIAGDLEQVERILSESLSSRNPRVARSSITSPLSRQNDCVLSCCY